MSTSTQILQHVTRIAEVLLALQQAGNVTYSGWLMAFDCATYTVIGHGPKQEVQLQEEAAAQWVSALHTFAKDMENTLREWENEVKEARSRHYELNYYTTLQLLKLRKELSHIRQNPCRHVHPEIVALLESISPQVTSESVKSVLVGLEKTLLDLRTAADCVPHDLYEEETVTQVPASMPIGNSVASDNAHLATPKVDSLPSPSYCSQASTRKLDVKPHLVEKDLNVNQRETLSNLVEYHGYSRQLVLKAFEECPTTANQYDIQDWCDEHEGVFQFETTVDVAFDDDSSSETSSDDEDKRNVFNQGVQISPSGNNMAKL